MLASWSYSLDTDQGIVQVQSAKDPFAIGKHYVIIAMRKPSDDTPVADETKTVVTKVQTLGDAEGTIEPLKIPCARIAEGIKYGEPVHFFLYVIPEDHVDALRDAVAAQIEHPLTIRRLVDEFGGIKRGGGTDGAAFDDDSPFVECACRALDDHKRNISQGSGKLITAPAAN